MSSYFVTVTAEQEMSYLDICRVIFCRAGKRGLCSSRAARRTLYDALEVLGTMFPSHFAFSLL
jgi:hypothetical protein